MGSLNVDAVDPDEVNNTSSDEISSPMIIRRPAV